jgi:iron(III) transport system substrate-binding protein
VGRITSRLALLLSLVAAGVMAIAGVAATSASGAALASASAASPAATKAGPATAKQWKAIVAKGKQEGEVTIYSSQNPLYLADFASRVKQKYGISVTINRQIDSVLGTQITVEEGAGSLKADVWITASLPHVLGAHNNGWVTDAVGPDLYKKAYNRKVFAKPAKAFIVGAAVLGLGWNTNQFSEGLKDFPDLLNSKLQGRIGVIAPAGAPSLVDWYHWVQWRYGNNFLPRLAALKPKIYPSSLPMTQAVASGELAAGSFVASNAVDLKAQGAPIGFKIVTNPWNAPYFAMMLKKSPHPNAAQVVMDFMVTSEGQSLVSKNSVGVVKGAANTTYAAPRIQKLNTLTPAKIAAFQKYWEGLFQ